MNILVLTYWSFREPLIQAATLPYLRLMREINSEVQIFLVTVEKDHLRLDPSELQQTREELQREGIELITFGYRRFGMGAMASWAGHIVHLRKVCKSHHIKVLHAFGSPVGAIAYMLSRLTRLPLVVDSYEPHAESMVENGSWSSSSLAYRLLFHFEKLLAKHTTAVLATTKGMREYALEKYDHCPRRFILKPACVDTASFRPEAYEAAQLRYELGFEGKVVCVYAGKLGGIYMREEIFSFFTACAKYWGSRFRVLLLTDAPEDEVIALAQEAGFDPKDLVIRLALHHEVPRYLACADFAINPVKPVPSKRYCTSIKDGEYWAMGLPVVIPPNISDDSELIEREGIGVVLSHWTNPDSRLDQLNNLMENRESLGERIRSIATRERSMDIARAGYGRLYGELGYFTSTPKRFLAMIYNSYADPLFQNLIFQYIRPLTRNHWHYTLDLITFEQEKYQLSKSDKERIRTQLEQEGIFWNPLDYHSGSLILLKKIYDFLAALWLTARLKWRQHIDLIISMGNTSAAITVKLSRLLKIDMMAYSFEPHSEFMADFGIWDREGWKFKILKSLEDEAAEHSKYILTGTRHMVKELEGKTTAEVYRAPSCADEDIFSFDPAARKRIRKELSVEQRNVLVYAGKFGGIYYDREVAEFFKALLDLDPKWYMLILSPSDHGDIQQWFEAEGVESSDYYITEARSPAEVASWLSASDMGLSAIPPLPSQRFRSPIKVGEYLMCGLPFITCKGISEDDLYATEYDVGIVIEELDRRFAEPTHIQAGRYFEESKEELRARCRSTGIAYRGKAQLHGLFDQIWKKV